MCSALLPKVKLAAILSWSTNLGYIVPKLCQESVLIAGWIGCVLLVPRAGLQAVGLFSISSDKPYK